MTSAREGEARGRVALVTGASRGIGAAIARRLAAEGARVAVTARSAERHPHLPGSLEETVAAIRAGGGEAVAIPGDLADADVRRHVVEETERSLGAIDVLVSNAAAAFYMPIPRSASASPSSSTCVRRSSSRSSSSRACGRASAAGS